MNPDPANITQLLAHTQLGDSAALEQLLRAVYPDLRRIAAQLMRRERPNHTFQPTALVNEAFLRLFNAEPGNTYQNRAHFFRTAAKRMRAILTDHARMKHASKRGAGFLFVPLETNDLASELNLDDLAALDQALNRLAAMDPRAAQTVELRFFAGHSVEETAAILGYSAITVERDWEFARLWLRRALTEQ